MFKKKAGRFIMKYSYSTIAILIIISLSIISCAARYQKLDDQGGYYDEQKDANLFLAKFVGNQHNTMKETKFYALYRAAELSRKNGAQYFQVNAYNHYFGTHTSICYSCSGAASFNDYRAPRAEVIIELRPKSETGLEKENSSLEIDANKFISKYSGNMENGDTPDIDNFLSQKGYSFK
jgi:hypothetical protein